MQILKSRQVLVVPNQRSIFMGKKRTSNTEKWIEFYIKVLLKKSKV